jgi:hypothetical protein
MDGVNPFSFQSTNYTIWPILLINYNIPPWMVVWKEHLMLSLIVPRKHQVRDMDVYLEPLIEEMLLLWNGIQMYDIS